MTSQILDRPWWMSPLDDPPVGGLLRTGSVPIFGFLRVTAATGTGGGISDLIWDIGMWDANKWGF